MHRDRRISNFEGSNLSNCFKTTNFHQRVKREFIGNFSSSPKSASNPNEMSSGDSNNLNTGNNANPENNSMNTDDNRENTVKNDMNPGNSGSSVPPPSNKLGPIRVRLGSVRDERTAARPYPQPNVTQAPDGTLTIHINLTADPATALISGRQANAAASSTSSAGEEKKHSEQSKLKFLFDSSGATRTLCSGMSGVLQFIRRWCCHSVRTHVL